VQNAEIMAELYRIYGVKYLDEVPYASLGGIETVLKSLGKGNDLKKASEFIDNSLIEELKQEGLFQVSR
jgi:hypothetical protein